jgi:Putative prokaryotic signal transducing protein
MMDEPKPVPSTFQKMVRVRGFAGPTANTDAELAKGILDNQGIPAVVSGAQAAEIVPGVDTVQLLVHEEDAAEASELLESFLDNPSRTPADEEA